MRPKQQTKRKNKIKRAKARFFVFIFDAKRLIQRRHAQHRASRNDGLEIEPQPVRSSRALPHECFVFSSQK